MKKMGKKPFYKFSQDESKSLEEYFDKFYLSQKEVKKELLQTLPQYGDEPIYNFLTRIFSQTVSMYMHSRKTIMEQSQVQGCNKYPLEFKEEIEKNFEIIISNMWHYCRWLSDVFPPGTIIEGSIGTIVIVGGWKILVRSDDEGTFLLGG